MDWEPFKEGASIGQRGSENGVILRDEVHVDGARITLERDGRMSPFAITCGIYGWMVHTHFFCERQVTEAEYEEMREELSAIIDIIPLEEDPDAEDKLNPVIHAISEFVERYP